MAVAFLALIAVVPEYAVDMYFAWVAGKDPQYTAYATANMTGANRLLIGVGWAAVVFAYWLKTARRSFTLEPAHKIEIFYLSVATLYSFWIPFKTQLDLSDALILIAIFVFYIRTASKAAHVEPELEGPTDMIAGWQKGPRRLTTPAQSLFAVAVLANLSFSLTKAALLAVLFSTQLLNPDPWFRYLYSFLYVLLTAGLFIASRDSRESFFGLFRGAASAS